jgi:excisionase family DNA binding protein
MLRKRSGRPVEAIALEGRPFTKDQLAEWMSVTPRFVEMEVKRGALRAIILGRRTVRFLPKDVNTWLNTRPTTESEEQEVA